MFLIIQELTKTQEPSPTLIETHFSTYEPNETKRESKCTDKNFKKHN